MFTEKFIVEAISSFIAFITLSLYARLTHIASRAPSAQTKFSSFYSAPMQFSSKHLTNKSFLCAKGVSQHAHGTKLNFSNIYCVGGRNNIYGLSAAKNSP